MSDHRIQSLRRKVANGDINASEILKHELHRNGMVEDAWKVLIEAKALPIWARHSPKLLYSYAVHSDTTLHTDRFHYRNESKGPVNVLVFEI